MKGMCVGVGWIMSVLMEFNGIGGKKIHEGGGLGM